MENTGGVSYTNLLQSRENKTVCGKRREGEGKDVIQPDHAANHVITQPVT